MIKGLKWNFEKECKLYDVMYDRKSVCHKLPYLVRFAALSETFKVSIDLQVLRTLLITYAPVKARQAATLLRVCRQRYY